MLSNDAVMLVLLLYLVSHRHTAQLQDAAGS